MNDDNYIVLNSEGLAEINPTASSDMQNAFIDTYRNIQNENTAQIGAQAHALGSDLPAQLGGIHGPSEYTRSRYQTPQTEARVAGLRTAAQLSALNQLMQNEQNKWSNRYNQAYRAAAKRASTPKTPVTPNNPSDNIQPDIVTNILGEYDVAEDAFFKKAEQEQFANQLYEKQAREKGMTVDEYKNWLQQRNNMKNATNPVGTTGGIGAYDFTTKAFNNGLGI